MLDYGVTLAERRAAVRALKLLRGKNKCLDLLVDAIVPRRIAHVAEEALRACAGGVGLWRHSGVDESLISGAIKWLNNGC